MFEKKVTILRSPDLSKLKEIIIDHKTRIYVHRDADAEEARNKYLLRNASKRSR